MTDLTCDQVRDLLPDRYHGELASPLRLALERHLERCSECREEAEFVDRLWESRPAVPPGLEAAVLKRLREEGGVLTAAAKESPGEWRDRLGRWGVRGTRQWFGVPSWALSVAALLVVALGTGVLWDRWSGNTASNPDTGALEIDPMVPETWLWDNGVVAGGPVLEGLTEEDLETLLRELGG